MKRKNPEQRKFTPEDKQILDKFTVPFRTLYVELTQAQERIHGNKKNCKCEACTRRIEQVELKLDRLKKRYARASRKIYNQRIQE